MFAPIAQRCAGYFRSGTELNFSNGCSAVDSGDAFFCRLTMQMPLAMIDWRAQPSV
jgi:hypothetical protein